MEIYLIYITVYSMQGTIAEGLKECQCNPLKVLDIYYKTVCINIPHEFRLKLKLNI